MAAAAVVDLQGAVLFEKDVYGSIITAWSYPAIPEGFEHVLRTRSQLEDDSALPAGAPPFVWGRFKNLWHYSMICEADQRTNPKVESFSIVLLSANFNPEKFALLLQLMCAQYRATASPTAILEGYLKAFTTGQYACDAGSWKNAQFSDQRALISGCSLKEIVGNFGMHSVLLWNAMLLKKRIIVYGDVLPDLLSFVRAMPQLVWHRQRWSILRPIVASKRDELDELAAAGVFVAGFLDRAVRGGDQYYDVFVDLPERRVMVAEHAKEQLTMGQFHKDLAAFMTQQAKAEDGTDAAMIKAVAQKTRELIDSIAKMCTPPAEEGAKPRLRAEDLKAKSLGASMERFIFNVAVAEGMAEE